MGPDLSTTVGSIRLPNPVMTASGTAGHGSELAAYGRLDQLGAVVVKSLSVMPWPGNPPPRLRPAGPGMLNSVGLQGPGVGAWRQTELPGLQERGARVVVSLWGRTVAEFGEAAAALAGARGVVAVEVNVSCPNLEDRSRVFAHSPAATAEAVAACGAAGLPRWVKLSPNVPDIAAVAGAALDAGAAALTVANTLLGMVVDLEARHAMSGGLSGPSVHPVAVRAVWDCRRAYPEAAIVGSGGVSSGKDAIELLMAGADAVQVGTATFADPRAPWKVLAGIDRWCRAHRVPALRELVGAAHDR